MTATCTQLQLLLCFFVRLAVSQGTQAEVVHALLDQPVTLKCSFHVPVNWNLSEIHIMWFRNFTDKLLDCKVGKSEQQICENSSHYSRTSLASNPFYGNAALKILKLQESDVGMYQCWVIFPEAYVRINMELRLQDKEPSKEINVWVKLYTQISRNFIMLSGWLIALLLILKVLSRRCRSKGKKNFKTHI
ncbi:CD276 antigen-like [Pelobates fuscus]|uniref:CD276 antigen-like n=1 Tax=Pelobates fuscus TaxID=191477 RepID=UPI002FE456B6